MGNWKITLRSKGCPLPLDCPGEVSVRVPWPPVFHRMFHVVDYSQIQVRSVTESDAFLVLASDGVWEFMQNQEVRSVGQRCSFFMP